MSDEIELRDVVRSDLPILFQHQHDPLANQMAAFPAREWQAFLTHWEKIMDDDAILLQTILFEGQVAGNVVCFEFFGQREFGYWVGQEYWGKGIATRALAQFLSQVPFRPLFAHVARHNVASYRVLEKCGFHTAIEEQGELILELD